MSEFFEAKKHIIGEKRRCHQRSQQHKQRPIILRKLQILIYFSQITRNMSKKRVYDDEIRKWVERPPQLAHSLQPISFQRTEQQPYICSRIDRHTRLHLYSVRRHGTSVECISCDTFAACYLRSSAMNASEMSLLVKHVRHHVEFVFRLHHGCC